ncbi:GIY-YIG nuclease family protein [Streptococcus loxodontisalivarius]|uniref:Endonuclease n=1 Tax=Streptococcus loxodontisalivarius TaxID=1349415 RepID=A0ABS2PTA4_9STRE|nr:GIY-YIG nuclease family protein [Streptococcus loxodontisalivarius]MBM7643166.1 putative endonuclease [Streptococcus loxodontisalivarius]
MAEHKQKKEEKDSKKAYMYVVACADGSLYTGYTTDVERRIKNHNAGRGAKYTKTRLPVKLLYWEEHDSKSAAMSAESYFKRKKRQAKLDYIAEHKTNLSD